MAAHYSLKRISSDVSRTPTRPAPKIIRAARRARDNGVIAANVDTANGSAGGISKLQAGSYTIPAAAARATDAWRLWNERIHGWPWLFFRVDLAEVRVADAELCFISESSWLGRVLVRFGGV